MYDIAIIGLGPAGATLARLLSTQYNIIAIDRKNTEVSKCCGGLLSPDAQKILAQFDICLPKNILADPQIFSVRTIDMDNDIEKFYQRFYMNMDRAKFDNFLISLIPSTVEICSNSVCTKIEKEKYCYNFEFKTGEEKRTETAKIIIGADGANSIVRNTFYNDRRILKYTAIQEWYEDKTNSPFYSCIFDKKLTASYCWTISKDRYLIVGGAFPPTSCKERFDLLKEKLKSSGVFFGAVVKREACSVYLTKNLEGVCTGSGGAYLVGEAAGMISPSSLEGISYSMESAKILANILNEGLRRIGRKYYFRTFSIRMKLLRKIFKMPFMYNKFLRKLVMKSGIKSIKKD